MNEQILTKLVIRSSDKDGWLDRQKFAELIVKECIKICNDVSLYATAEYAGIAIKEHFGVEA
jgi:hypothetical protein